MRWRRFYPVLVVAILLLYLGPMFWIFTTSFKNRGEYFTYPPVFVPKHLSFSHFKNALFEHGGAKGILNSLIIASFCTVFSLAISAPAAYSLARFRVGGEHLAFWILSIRMLPPIAVVLPIFLFYGKLRLLDTYRGMILIHAIIDIPFAVWLLRGFLEDIPVSLEESALVDGCTRFQAFYKIALPLVAPGLVATALFSFIFSWNEFIFALILTRTKAVPITVVIPNLIGGHEILWAEISALALMASAPVIVFALFLQKYLIRGLTLGAVKG
ncbi:MAG: carbohydrate ABC transporter permease [Deltaproteobacteria bacterium]|nr:carbohydrate ABC transporter permease [Deltaproteobacteria bacterium]